MGETNILDSKNFEEKTEKETNQNLKKGLYTLGITVHDAMPAHLFEMSLNSVFESYKNMEFQKPVNIIISIDTESEEEFEKSLEQKTLEELIGKENNDLKFKEIDELNELEALFIDEERINKLNESEKKEKEERLDFLKKIKNEKEQEKEKKERENKELYDKYDGEEEKIEEEIKKITKKRIIERFKKNKEEKREFIEKIQRITKENNLNLNIDTIESTKKYGKVSGSRNRIIDICNTKYLIFLDGDDHMNINALQKIQNECENNESPNHKSRVDYTNNKNLIEGPADVIYLENGSGKSPCGNVYNVLKLREFKIKFPKGIGSEDGYFKLLLMQNGFKIVKASDENMGFIDNYIASNSTILFEKNNFKTIIQLVNHLVRRNKESFCIFNGDIKGEDSEREFNSCIDFNNIFHYFNSGVSLEFDGYGTIFESDGHNSTKMKLDLDNSDDRIAITSIIYSLILYPEVLSYKNKDEAYSEVRDFFIEARKELKEKIEKNEDFKISDVISEVNVDNYKLILGIIKDNFAIDMDDEEFINKINECLDENEENKNIFIELLQNLELDKEGNVNNIKNPHLMEENFDAAALVDFDKYLSAIALKEKIELDEGNIKNQATIMNKILKGKLIPKEYLILNEEEKENLRNNSIERSKLAIQYLFYYNNGDKKNYIFDIIKETNEYKNNLEIKEFVDNCYNEKEIININFEKIKYYKLEAEKSKIANVFNTINKADLDIVFNR